MSDFFPFDEASWKGWVGFIVLVLLVIALSKKLPLPAVLKA